MLLLLFSQTPGDGVSIAIATTLPAPVGSLVIDSGTPQHVGVVTGAPRRRVAPGRVGVRIVTVLPSVRSRLLLDVHDDDLATVLLVDYIKLRGDL